MPNLVQLYAASIKLWQRRLSSLEVCPLLFITRMILVQLRTYGGDDGGGDGAALGLGGHHQPETT